MTSSISLVRTQAAFEGLHYAPSGVIFAVDGTAYPGAPFPPVPIVDGNGWWAGFSSGMVGGLAQTQDGLFASSCIAYPAWITNMWASIQVGRTGLVNAIAFYEHTYAQAHGSLDGLAIFLTGYSQGACVTNQVWTQDILLPTGALHHLQPYIWRVYNFGDPLRTPEIAYGNQMANMPMPKKEDGYVTGGIGGDLDLTPEQTTITAPDGRPVVNCFALDGDLYTCCPTGPDPWKHMASPGKVGHSIMHVIFHATLFNVLSVAKALGHPVGMVQEIVNGLKFAAQGQTAPHWRYQDAMVAAIGEMLTIGNSLPHQGC